MHTYTIIFLTSLFDVSCYDVTFNPFTNLRYLFTFNDLFQTPTITDFTKMSNRLSISDTFFMNNYVLFSISLFIAVLVLISLIFNGKCFRRVSCLFLRLPLKDSLVYNVLMMPLAFGYIYYYFITSFIQFTENSHGYTDWSSVFNSFFMTLFVSLIVFYQININLDKKNLSLA